MSYANELNMSCSALAVIYAKNFYKNTCPIVGIKNTKETRKQNSSNVEFVV